MARSDSPRRAKRAGGWLWPLAAATGLLAAAACSREQEAPRAPSAAENGAPAAAPAAARNAAPAGTTAARDEASEAELFRLRNIGKLQADRDSDEGYLEAIATYRSVVAKSRDVLLDRLNLACVLLLSEDLAAEALPEIDAARALAAAPGAAPGAAPRLEYLTGLYQKSEGDHAAAAESFRKVTEARPELLQAWYQRGRALEEIGSAEEAEMCFRRALAIKADFRPAAYRRFMALQRFSAQEEVTAAKNFFETLSEAGQPDTAKCELTRVDRRAYERARHEPPRARLEWRDRTESLLAAAPDMTGGARVVRAVAALDGDRDGYPELVFLCADGAWRAAFGAEGARAPEQILAATSLAAPIDAAAADLDNDKQDEILLAGAGGIALLPGGALVQGKDWASPVRGMASSPRAVDADHDGDLDVICLTDGGARILRNNGDGNFLVLAPFGDSSGGSGGEMRLRLDFHDLDQGNDLDFVVPSATGAGFAALNRRDGTFRLVPLDGLGQRTLYFAEDIDNDGAPDIFACGGDPGWAYALNADRFGMPGELRLQPAIAVAAPQCGTIHDATFADVDNDTDLDVVLATDRGVTLLRNDAARGLVEEDSVPLAGGQRARRMIAADLDADCLLEVVVVTADGRVAVLGPAPAPLYAGITLRPWGARDNYNAIGTVVESFAGALYQSVMIKGPQGVSIGAGAADPASIDGVRLRWPQGLIQPLLLRDLEFEPNCEARFQQKEGQIVSCPFLYGRGAAGWKFLTDIVGIAPLDEWLPPGQTPHLDPEEWVRIEGDALQPIDGYLELCITEELKETTYLDRVELACVDHPEAIALYLDESTRQGAYEPLAVHALRHEDLCAARRVTCASGADVTAVVAERDGRYAHPYGGAPSQWHGWVPRHDLAIEAAEEVCAILLSGRIDWYDSTVSYALAQHGRKWGPLRLLAASGAAEGNQAREILVEDLGLPAGMDRTMVATFPACAAGARFVLSGHHRFLWDHVRFARKVERVALGEGDGNFESSAGTVRCRRMAAQAALLGYHGYSSMRGDRAGHEQDFDFGAAGPEDCFVPATGMATRYGDVLELIRAHDDLLAVLVAGDKVTIRFASPPAPGPGLRRTFFLRVSGWAKEANFHNRTGRTIEPLPLRDMRHYPPAAGAARRDQDYERYLETYQTRRIGF